MNALATVLVMCLWPLATNAAAIAEGERAPPIEARLFDGAEFSLANQAGNVVVINFWATWCAPCREEMPALDAYYRLHRSEGLEIVAISMDSPKDEAKARAMMNSYSFPAAFVRETNAKGYGRIWRLPLTFVIDRQGILRKDGWYGNPLLDTATLEQTLTPLLRGRSNTAVDGPPRARMSAVGPPQSANCAPSGGSAAATAASVGVHIAASSHP